MAIRSNKFHTRKCFFYKEFKRELKCEKYLTDLDVSLRYFLVRFRTCNHRLPIETGRCTNVLNVKGYVVCVI